MAKPAQDPGDPGRVGDVVAYVFFRSPPQQRDSVRAAFGRLALALRAAGLPAPLGLAWRHEPARDDLTWLETYGGPDLDSVRAQLLAVERLAADCGLSGLATGARQIEIFETCA